MDTFEARTFRTEITASSFGYLYLATIIAALYVFSFTGPISDRKTEREYQGSMGPRWSRLISTTIAILATHCSIKYLCVAYIRWITTAYILSYTRYTRFCE
jgi:hypothetical protein